MTAEIKMGTCSWTDPTLTETELFYPDTSGIPTGYNAGTIDSRLALSHRPELFQLPKLLPPPPHLVPKRGGSDVRPHFKSAHHDANMQV